LTQALYEFSEFEIDCARLELWRNGRVVKLEHIPMEFARRRPLNLAVLVGEQQPLVERQQFRDHGVADGNLPRARRGL
jgi:hypothetical protein